ncbi:DnaD domain protein [Enterococcus sp. ALS3]|uniref:DnaD domain protein n=1 Tax=Enterococcus alishanensis TaxID=1303817 RepID=A0ABS6TBT5_9ENTE|nr:DnaD domain protein [Enterococcus alishanensis]
MEEIKPTTFYTVYGVPQLDQSNQQALLYLYQPIIGSQALALYLNLNADITLTGKSQEIMHTDLLSAIDLGLPNMIKAREKLEGLGLLESFEKKDTELGLQLVYQLHTPMKPETFFQDPIMSYLLLNKIGERRYQRLVDRFKPANFNKKGLKNIAKTFREIYNIQESNFEANAEVLKQTQDMFVEETLDKGFDWETFNHLIQKFKIHLNDQTKKAIESLHIMYAVNEIEMADFVGKASVGETQHLDLNYLRQLLGKQDKPSEEKPVKVKPESFTKGEARLLEESKKFPPVQYFKAIKKQKGVSTQNNELKLIEKMLTQQKLTSGVVNILINYALVVQKQSYLNENYITKIAQDWSAQGIDTPEKAISRLKNNNQKFVKKKTSNNFSQRKNFQTRTEALPEHIKQPPVESSLSEEKTAELNRKLAQFLNKEGDN